MSEVHLVRIGAAVSGVYAKHACAMAAAFDHRRKVGGRWEEEEQTPGVRTWAHRTMSLSVSVETRMVR